MLIDSHAHVNFNAYKNDADEVIRRSLDGSTGSPQVWVINIGSQYTTSQRATEIAEKYPEGVYAAIGLHPINLETGLVKIKEDPEEAKSQEREAEFDCERYKELAKSPKVVAIGEIGLDYYWKPKTKIRLQEFKEKQKKLFLKQLKLANELNLPVVFHCRMAHDDLIELLLEYSELRPKNAVAHSFVGSLDQLQKYLDFGFYIGFNGIIFKSIEGVSFEEAIKQTPLEKILVETDCPYLTPPQEKGRNEPLYVKYIAQKIAELKDLTFEGAAQQTTGNTRKLFGI